MQTLSPRWFVAARHESTLAPALITATSVGQRRRLTMIEATVGFRVTPEVTLRSSYYTRQVLRRVGLGPPGGRAGGLGPEVVVIVTA